MTIKEMIQRKVLGILGLVEEGKAPEDDRLTFINDSERLVKQKIQEYNIWYQGDGDELLNYYTHKNTIEYNYEPWYSRNKRSYYWAISSTETDIKRSHSGQPRNIIDTLVAICPFPNIQAGEISNSLSPVQKNLEKIIKNCRLKSIYKHEQMPMTLVEGWGCYKINFDKDFSDYPTLMYYRAENVDFIYKQGQIIGIIFRDYYTNKKERYMSVETRYFSYAPCKKKKLIIETELYRVNLHDSEYIEKVGMNNVPEMRDTETKIEGENIDCLFAVPSIFIGSTSGTGEYGRSIFTGKIDLFDDLDQCLSQQANAIRKSTPIEYFNIEFLERDSMGLPKQPHAFDRKYTLYKGMPNADGTVNGDPVTITQPTLNTEQYNAAATAVLLQIINGIMSPATLGIDIAKKDNAEAQREKEKVTIFTRNMILEEETEILKSLCSQLLVAYELMNTGVVTVPEYEISVFFNTFADDSFENKIERLSVAFDSETISEDMFMKMLYGNDLNRAEYEKEKKWLKEHHTKPRDDGMLGASGGGQNVPGQPTTGGNPLEALMGGEQDEENSDI